MVKKERATQEIANYWPTWSRIRTDDQSIGFQFFNALAHPIDKMDKYLETMKWNQYLDTVNLDEVDLLYKVQLPVTYEFAFDTSDPLSPIETAPAAVGTVGGTDYEVSLADDNSLENMWYEAIPARATLKETLTDVSDRFIQKGFSDFPWSGSFSHFCGGGRLWVNVHSGTQYISINEDGEVDKGQVVIHGTTRKDTEEVEHLYYAWDEKRPTLKEWADIDYVEAYDMDSDVEIDIRSANFNNGPYWAFYNLRYSQDDNKIDEFWDLGGFARGSTLDLVLHISDKWQDLLLGFSDKASFNRWELLDSNWNNVSALDVAVQPFTDRIWAIGNDAKLYCYELGETMVSGADFLASKTSGSEVKIEFADDYTLIGEDIGVTPIHIRPLRDINKYRIWYETPTGSKYGLYEGSSVSFSSDFWNYPLGKLNRELEGQILLETLERGEYKFTLEAVFSDGNTEYDKAIAPIQYKLPLTTIDLSSNMSGEVMSGIDFDSDQRLWVKSHTSFYRFDLHTDLMIVDYNDKVVYFREDYDSVEIT